MVGVVMVTVLMTVVMDDVRVLGGGERVPHDSFPHPVWAMACAARSLTDNLAEEPWDRTLQDLSTCFPVGCHSC